LRTPPYDLRPALTFFFPDGLDPSAIPVVARGRDLPTRAPAAIGRGRDCLTGREFREFQERHAFWAVPRHLERPRALVPVTDPAAARTLLAPRSVVRSPFKRALHRGMSSASPVAVRWAGRPLVVASQERSQSLRALQAMAPRAAVGCYLGNKANEGRLSVQAFVGGAVHAIAKVVYEDEGRPRVAWEASILRGLEEMPTLRPLVPKLGAHVSGPFGEVLVTDAFDGRPGPTNVDAQIMSFLSRCHLGGLRDARDAELVQRATRLTRAAGYGQLGDRARRLLAEPAPIVVTHGDFTPWNIRLVGKVAKAFDWEYGCLDGLPDWDELFFRIQVGIVKGSWQRPELESAVRSWLTEVTRTWTPDGRRGLAALLLLDLAARYQRRGDPSRENLVLPVARALVA
jgi:hypothetical protein